MPHLPSALVFVPSLAVWLAVLSLPGLRGFADDAPRRYAAIDGLRGLLAISVFAHHFAVMLQWRATSKWADTANPAWSSFGHSSVALFFMITGLLFFQKIGNPARRLNFASFLWARVLRIYPVFLVCLVAAMLLVAALGGGPTQPLEAMRDLGWWLVFVPQQLLGMPDAGMIVAYAPWSLRYEWLFYLSLPLLAFAWRAVRFHPAFLIALCGIALCLTRWPFAVASGEASLDTRYIAPFALGGVAVLLVRSERLRRILPGPIGSGASFAALVLVCTRGEPFSVKAYMVLFAAFVPIAADADLFGLLRLRAMQILGAISFDVYLLHGLVLFVALHLAAPGITATKPTLILFLVLTGLGVLVIALALLVHRTVERPAMSASARLRSSDPRERLAAP